MTTVEAITPDLGAVKQRQQQMWASGDFHAVATLIQPVAETLVEAVDLRADWRVLDVATGSGNAAIAAARSGCDVVGIDYVPGLLARGRRRVEAEGVSAELIEGDAEAIPFPDASFDAVLSVFGSMFAPNHEQAAVGDGARLPPRRPDRPRDVDAGWVHRRDAEGGLRPRAARRRASASPLLWGTQAHLSTLFGDTIDGLACRERTFTFRFRSAEAFVEYFRAYYGPTLKAFEAVGETGADELFDDLVGLVRRYAGTTDGPVAIPATWLETVATRSSR